MVTIQLNYTHTDNVLLIKLSFLFLIVWKAISVILWVWIICVALFRGSLPCFILVPQSLYSCGTTTLSELQLHYNETWFPVQWIAPLFFILSYVLATHRPLVFQMHFKVSLVFWGLSAMDLGVNFFLCIYLGLMSLAFVDWYFASDLQKIVAIMSSNIAHPSSIYPVFLGLW